MITPSASDQNLGSSEREFAHSLFQNALLLDGQSGLTSAATNH